MITSILMLGARLLIALPFVLSAIPKLKGDRAEEDAIAGLGLPAPRALEVICALCLVAGSAALALGTLARPAAALLAAFVAVVTPLFMPFWTKEGEEKQKLTQAFVTNFGLAGGLVYVAIVGAGRLAL